MVVPFKITVHLSALVQLAFVCILCQSIVYHARDHIFKWTQILYTDPWPDTVQSVHTGHPHSTEL